MGAIPQVIFAFLSVTVGVIGGVHVGTFVAAAVTPVISRRVTLETSSFGYGL